MRNFLLLLAFVLLNSCSFNKIFLQPEKAPPTAKEITMVSTKDTIVISFAGNNYQPTFIKRGRSAIDSDFTIQSVLFKSKSGNNLNGWFLKPSGNSVPKITLLFLHGNGGNITTEYFATLPFLKKGFQAFIFDYSGYGFSDGKATKNNILIDALSALDYIKTRQDIKDTKLVIYGQSLGGYLATIVATQRQKDINGLVIEGCFTSYKDIAAHKVPILGRILVKKSYSAVESIESFHKPLLVIHSTEDRMVPFFMGKKIYDNANEPKSFYVIKKCHICGPVFYSDSISEKIKLMLQ